MLSRSQEMLERLQPFMRQSDVYKVIFEAGGQQFAQCDEAVEDVQRQFCIETATWALAIYEKELGLSTANKSLVERRSSIKAKMRGAGKLDAMLMKLVADSYTNGDVDVKLHNGITIQFKGVSPNQQGLRQAIEEIKPAHLAYQFEEVRDYRGTIEVQSHYNAYTYDIPFAGTLYCGTWPETATWGELYTTDMELSNDCKATLQRPYQRAGETVAGSQQVFKNKTVQVSNELAVHEENYRELNPYPLAGEQPCGTIPETATWGREIETTLEVAEETQVTAQSDYKRCGVTRAEETKR